MRQLADANTDDGEFIITQSAEDITLAQNDVDDQINSIFAEVGSDKNEVTFHFQVWRVLKDQADMAFLFKGLVSDLPIMERLRDEYDGGKFFIQIYKNKKRFKQLKVTVEKPKSNVTTAVVAVKNDMVEMIKAINEQQQQQFNMLKETLLQIAGKQVTPTDPMAMMASMMGAMMQMKNFLSPAQPENSISPDKMIDVLLKGMEMGKDSGGGSETGFLDIVKELIKSPALATALTAAQNVPQLPKARNAPAIQNNSQSTNPANLSPGSREEPKMNAVIARNLEMLVSKAEKDADPILYAEFIIDNVPESMIKEHILRDDLIESLSKINPKVTQYKEWFLELRDHIQGVLTGEGDEGETVTDEPAISEHPSDDTAGDGGDTPHS